jgi:CheY-like chemotaxis protein
MARSRKGRVLIVEDNLATLRLLQSMLTPIVEVVYEATSGVEALAILNREEVDLLITDLKMPEMDGLELMRRTRSLLPELPAIVVTADESRQAVLTALRLGAINYLTKPIQVEELAIAVHQGMERVEMLARIRRRETLWGKTKELLVWLMKSFANPVFIVDDNGICLFSNEAAARFFGIPSGPPANWRFGRLSKSHGEEDIGLLSPCQRPCLATMRMSRAAWENSEVTFVLVDNMCEAAEGVSILE